MKFKHTIEKTHDKCSPWIAAIDYYYSVNGVQKHGWIAKSTSTKKEATSFVRVTKLDIIKDAESLSDEYSENDKKIS